VLQDGRARIPREIEAIENVTQIAMVKHEKRKPNEQNDNSKYMT
jgi:hypothetical protein